MTWIETIIGFGFFFTIIVALTIYFKVKRIELIIPFTLIAGSLTVLSGLLEWWIIALIFLIDIILLYLNWRSKT